MITRLLILTLATLTLSVPAFALSVDGTLEVQQGALKVVRTDGFKARFYQGKYTSQLSFQSGKLYLVIHRKDVRTDAELKLPAGFALPENGDFKIDGVKAGQAFNVDGTIGTAITDSLPRREYESCTYYRREWVCEGRYDEYCRWEDVPVQGDREVEYFVRTKTVTLAIDLPSPGEGRATFAGAERSSKKIYTYEGRCR